MTTLLDVHDRGGLLGTKLSQENALAIFRVLQEVAQLPTPDPREARFLAWRLERKMLDGHARRAVYRDAIPSAADHAAHEQENRPCLPTQPP